MGHSSAAASALHSSIMAKATRMLIRNLHEAIRDDRQAGDRNTTKNNGGSEKVLVVCNKYCTYLCDDAQKDGQVDNLCIMKRIGASEMMHLSGHS